MLKEWWMYPDMNYSSSIRRRIFEDIAKMFIKGNNSSVLILCHVDDFIVSNPKEAFFLNGLYIMTKTAEIGGYWWKDIFINKKSQGTVSSKGTYSCSFIRVAA